MPGLRVLVLDGGGSKGFFMLEVLRYIEISCGRPIRECFDLIVGTSIGALIATCLTVGKSIDEIESEVFPFITTFSKIAPLSFRTVMSMLLWGHVLDASDWAAHMETLVGSAHLSELPDSPRLVLVAADATATVPHPYLIRSRPLPAETAARSPFATTSDISLMDAIRATTAAPTIYPAHIHDARPVVDGGVVCNNPILLAMAEVNLLGETLDCVVSIGTGLAPRPPNPNPKRGLLGWTWSLIMRSVDSDTAAELALGLLSPSQYFRFDPLKVGECDTWEANPAVLFKRRKDVQEYMHSHEDTLVALVPRLCREIPAVQDNEDRSVSNPGGS